MIRNLVLDIGNVICDWDPHRLVSLSFESPEEVAQAIAVTIQTPDWLDLDRGTLELDEAIRRAQARSELPPERLAQVYANVGESLTELPSTTAAMQRAHEAGIPIYIVSNMADHAWDYLERHLNCWQLCDGLVISCQVKLIKPDPAIFKYLCDTHQLAAESCVFIDDMAENIAAAEKFGLRGIQLTDKHQGGQVIDDLISEIVNSR